jgi:hypothetical protein
MLHRFDRHGKRAWLAFLLMALVALPLYADAPTRAQPLRHPTSRPPGQGWTSGALVNSNAPRHTAWDHPYVDVDAADSINNLRYGNLDMLSGYGYGGGYYGGFGLGWGWAGGVSLGYTMGWYGLPY